MTFYLDRFYNRSAGCIVVTYGLLFRSNHFKDDSNTHAPREICSQTIMEEVKTT